MVQRTAGWNSRAKVKGRLQAALYYARKTNKERQDESAKPNPPEAKEESK